ncbi:MAG TPA: MFS transporter, partial [Gammaproteobacteria bacterium]|nr:MFS transporter [Gammaproteobacteria bacterium]
IMVDLYGPRRVYSTLLILSSVICVGFASAQSFDQLALFRFLLGVSGAGFVIGIRMVGEWFPAKQVGIAEGIYGGWGNFGSAAAAMSLPAIAYWFGGDEGWRYALYCTAAIIFVYGIVYFLVARDTPKGSTYFKPKKHGGLEVSSVKDFYFYIFMNLPMYLALSVLTWKLSPSNIGLLAIEICYAIYLALVALFIFQVYNIYRVNIDVFKRPVEEIHRYQFKQVAILDLAYLVTFGSELAVVSMLPLFFLETYTDLNPVKAGLLASGFAFMNLVARPSGGWFSDTFGRRKSLSFLILGLSFGYLILSQINSQWPIFLAVLATMSCSFFVQAGEGAVFAVVPLVKRRMTGQIAGMVGAYGNVGAVIFLTVLTFVDYSTFFLIIGGSAILVLVAVQFLVEPRGKMAEILPDGSVQLIDVG